MWSFSLVPGSNQVLVAMPNLLLSNCLLPHGKLKKKRKSKTNPYYLKES